MNGSGFVHLHVHTQFSLLDGACQLPQLVEEAIAHKMPALAITDHGNIFGAVEFYAEAKKNGIKPIIGCEIYIAPEGRLKKQGVGRPMHLCLLAKNLHGYQNLVRLVSIGYLEGFYYKPRIDREVLREFVSGLIGMSGCLKGEIAAAVMAGEMDKARESAVFYRDVFEPDSFYLELMDHGIPEQAAVNRGLIKLGRELGIPVVATNDVHYLRREMAQAHEILLCLQTQTTLEDASRMRLSTEEFYFKSEEEMRRLFKDVPEAISNTLKIANMCDLELDFSQTHLPDFKLPEGKTDIGVLREECFNLIPKRYPESTDEIRERLERELKVIESSGFASYFLIVADFVRFAVESRIPVGPGRGSAAGSIVSYLLGITEIDPLRYDLLFERFLNPERVSFPDIDIDFCYERRDEVIRYVTEKYGRDNVAQIITFGTMAAKGVVRDVARVIGLPYAEADRIAKLIPADPSITLAQAVEIEPELKTAYARDEIIKKLIDIALVLEGLTRHASTHAAGVVIGDRPLCEYIPLFKSSEDQITTGYTMKSLEKIGLLKMDFLGLKTLTVIDQAVKIIRRTRNREIDVNKIDLTDRNTFELFCRADTLGVFQLESAGMRDILKKLQPDKFEDIIALLALYRPGPLGSGMVDDFIKRKRSGKGIRYDHPLLEPVLRDTYGIILYQEQVMRISNVLAGFSLGQADILRRAMGKKKKEVIENIKTAFMEGAQKNNVLRKVAERVFELIEYFAGYGFNKSHSTAYAFISYQTAFLKANYPVEFLAALLSSEKDNSDKIALYINESSRMGIRILPPDINESFSQFTVVDSKAIRFGLSAVKNVGQGAVDAVIKARREGGPFSSLYEFCEQVDLRSVNKKVIESLIKCGAFDSFGLPRAQLMADSERVLNLANSIQKDKQNGQLLLFGNISSDKPESNGQSEEWPLPELLAYEKKMLGFYITAHPLDPFRLLFKRFGLSDIEKILDRKVSSSNGEVAFGAVISKVKVKITKRKAEKMAVLLIEDGKHNIEGLVFPEVYSKKFPFLEEDAVMIVRGQVDIREDMPKVIVTDVIPVKDINRALIDSLSLNITAVDLKRNLLARIKSILTEHPGSVPVHLTMASSRRCVKVRTEAGVSINDRLISKLEEVLGREDVMIGLRK